MLTVAVYATVALVAVLMWPQTLGGRLAYVMVSGHSMEPTMHYGDVAVVAHDSSYHRGEIVAYRVPDGDVGAGAAVIHRIVGGNAHDGYITRGDHNDYDDPWRPHVNDIVGRRIAVIPNAGTLFSRAQGPLPLAVFAAILSISAALTISRKTGGGDSDPDPFSAPSDLVESV